MDIGEGYLDEKFAELRKAQLASAAAMIYIALVAAELPLRPDEAAARREELLKQAATDAVSLYFRV